MKGKRTKMKKYTALSVNLHVKNELRAPNGNTQFSICLKAPTKKRVAELLAVSGTHISLFILNSFHGLWENPTYHFDPPEDETIYFLNEHFNTPHHREWLKLSDWKR